MDRTRFPIAALRSVELGTPDLPGSERFYTEIWGLELAARENGITYLAGTGTDHHILALHRADRPQLLSVTFRAGALDDFQRLAASAEAAGATVVADPEPNLSPGGGIVLILREPQGSTLRIVHGDAPKLDSEPVASRPIRLAHVNINSRDLDGLCAFYQAGLGFRLTDRSKLMAFVRTNSDHHAVVVAEAPVNGLNHVAFLMPDLESVMRGSGRLVDNGYPIGWGVGRHGPGDNVFAYFVDPTGVVIEYTAEVLQVDDSYVVRGPSEWTWPPGRTDHWGVAPPKPDHVKAAQLAIPFSP